MERGLPGSLLPAQLLGADSPAGEVAEEVQGRGLEPRGGLAGSCRRPLRHLRQPGSALTGRYESWFFGPRRQRMQF